MVSFGTIFSLAVVGAVAAGGYALYRNVDKVGGAFTRGVEKNLVTPFGDYLDNLWKDLGDSVVDTATDTIQKAIVNPLKNIPNPTNVFTNPFPFAFGESGKSPATKSLPPAQLKLKPTPGAPKLIPPGASTIPQLLNIVNSQPKAGYYYQNFPSGGRQDRQINLQKGTADKLRLRGYDLTFLSPSQKLSPAAFNLFGKSKGYL